MPRKNSQNRSISDQVTAARLQEINEDLDDIYANGDDIGRVSLALSGSPLKVDIGAFPYQIHGTYGLYAGTTDLSIPNNSTKYINVDNAGVISLDSALDSNKALLASVVTAGGVITSLVNYKASVFGGYAGTGDVVGPASSTTDNIVTFGGTTGKVIKDSGISKTQLQAAITSSTDISCMVYQNAATFLAANPTMTSVEFQVEEYDTDNMHDNTTNNSRITFKTAGKYLVFGTITFAAGSSTACRILLNGTTPVASSDMGISISPRQASVSAIINVSVNDYVELQGVANANTSGNSQTRFGVQKLV